MLERARREMFQQPEDTLYNIELKANQMAASFITQSNKENDIQDIQDIITLYKVILTPSEVLIKKM